jgi:DNA-binding PadR family transcriptional regulator
MPKRVTSRFAILGLLTLRPMSGYDLKKFVDEAIHFFWNLSYGTIYPMLKRLEDEELVLRKNASYENRPERSVFSLTGKGRGVLAEWHEEDVELPQVNDEILLRLYVGHDVPIEKNIELVNRYRDKLHDRMKHYESIESESIEEARESRHGALSHATLRCGILTTRARIRWCQETLEMLRDQQTDVVGV